MPRKPIEWSKCIIYKIWKDDDFYVGSTTDFTNRKRSHKCSCTVITHKSYNLKLYQIIREKGGWNAWEMIPLEEYKECQSQIEARIREEEWRIKLNAQLNMRKSYISEEKSKEYIKQYHQEYNKEHKEEKQEYNKKYQQKYKKEIKEYKSQYRQDNAEKIKEKFECKCGGKYTHQGKSTHEKTKKHQTYLMTL